MQQFLHTIYVPVIWIIFQIKHFFVQTNWRRGYLALVPNPKLKVIKTQREKQGIENGYLPFTLPKFLLALWQVEIASTFTSRG
jgi:hypothetical protein